MSTVDPILPPLVNQSIDESYRRKILLSSSLIASAFMLPFMVARGMWDGFDSPVCYLLGICSIFLLTTPLLYRATGSVTYSGYYLTISTTMVLISYSFADGGFYSTSLPWFPILPLFSVFFAGTGYGILIGAVLLADLFFLYFAHQFGIVPESTLGPSRSLLLYWGSTTAVLTLLVVLAYLYKNWQTRIRDELIAANHSKDEFLSGVSHELRTPLNSILGFTEILQKGYSGELNAEQRQHVDTILASGDHLLAIVDDLLELTSIDLGYLTLHPEPFEIGPLVDTVVGQHRAKIEASNINLSLNIDDDLRSVWFILDQLRFRQILANLLSNAIKFSPPGGTISLIMRTDPHGRLRIEVLDSGPGIPDEHREKIFERFYQIHQSTDNKDPGTGIGLALTRHLVDLHGGRVFVDSHPAGSGGRFVVLLPLRRGTVPPSGSHDSSDGRRAL